MVELLIQNTGNRGWLRNGGFHRANGPSIMLISGVRLWFWYGLPVSEFEHMMLVAQGQAYG